MSFFSTFFTTAHAESAPAEDKEDQPQAAEQKEEGAEEEAPPAEEEEEEEPEDVSALILSLQNARAQRSWRLAGARCLAVRAS